LNKEEYLNKQVLKEKQVELHLSAHGNSVHDATASVFKLIHKHIYSEIEEPIIQMETLEVYYESIEEVDDKDKLLSKIEFNKKKKIEIKVKVILNVKYLDIGKKEE